MRKKQIRQSWKIWTIYTGMILETRLRGCQRKICHLEIPTGITWPCDNRTSDCCGVHVSKISAYRTDSELHSNLTFQLEKAKKKYNDCKQVFLGKQISQSE